MRTIRFFAAACLSLFLLLLASGASAVEQDPYRLGAPSMTQKNMERWVAAPGTGSKIWVKRQTPFPATGWTALPYKAMKNNAAGPALTMASLTYGDDTFRLYAFITANDNKVYYTVDNVLRPNGADPSWNAWAPLPTAGLPSGTVKSVPSADFTDVSGSSIKIVVRGNDDHPYVLVGTVGASCTVSFGSSWQIVSIPGDGAITSAPTIVLASSQESDIFGVTSQGYIIGWMYSNMPPVTGWYYGTSGAASWSAAVAVRSKMGASNNDLYFRKGNDASLYLLHPQRLGASGSQYIAWGAETYLGRTLYSSPGATSSGSTGSCDDVYVLGSDNYYWGRDNCGTIYDWYQVTLRP